MKDMIANRIVKYVICEPGGRAWAETRGRLGAARRLLAKARNAGLSRARIYARHANGDETGPYDV